ncbi:MAG: tetratricopeptide repeat protein [Aestuariibacter sp.]|nr:tetratricopeptide repeat protein [Aestuariibacter sp.]
MYHKKAVDYYNQGRELQQLGRLIDAEQVYRKAIKKQPNFVEAHNNLGNVLVDLERFDDAIRAYRKAVDLKPGHPMLLNNLGNAFQLQGENDKAIKWLNKALDKDPGYGDAYNNLGHAFSDLGDIDQAISAFRKSIELNPENEIAYRDLAKNHKFSEYDDEIRAMETFYCRQGLSNEQKMHLAFGLGKAYEDLGEYEKSIETVIEANRLKRGLINFSLDRENTLFDQIKQVFSAEFLTAHADTGFHDSTPIFIVGMPRSGTSLVEQILASHPDVFGAGELNELPDIIGSIKSKSQFPGFLSEWNAGKYEKTGREYIARIRKHSDSAKFITDKLPQNFINIGLIKLILPNARVIHCDRDAMDTCLSIFKNFFSHGHHYSYEMTELGQYYKLYQNMMKHWATTLPDFIYDLSYEALVTNQEAETRKLLAYCNLPWNDNCLSFHKTRRSVKTASNAQVRQPIYRDSVKLWKRFEEQLKPLKEAIDGASD